MVSIEEEGDCRRTTDSRLLRFLSFVDFSGTEKQPICGNLEILHKRDDPADFEISTVHVASLRVEMSAVNLVCFTEPGQTARQSSSVQKFLHYLEVPSLHIECVLRINSCLTHGLKLCL